MQPNFCFFSCVVLLFFSYFTKSNIDSSDSSDCYWIEFFHAVGIKGKKEQMCLFLCISEFLLHKGKPDLSLVDVNNNTALHLACTKVYTCMLHSACFDCVNSLKSIEILQMCLVVFLSLISNSTERLLPPPSILFCHSFSHLSYPQSIHTEGEVYVVSGSFVRLPWAMSHSS